MNIFHEVWPDTRALPVLRADLERQIATIVNLVKWESEDLPLLEQHVFNLVSAHSPLAVSLQSVVASLRNSNKSIATGRIDWGTFNFDIPSDSALQEVLLDGEKAESVEVTPENGQIRFRSEQGYADSLIDGAHQVLLRIKTGAQTSVIQPFNFWKENKRLQRLVLLEQGKRYAVVIGIGKQMVSFLVGVFANLIASRRSASSIST